MKNLLIPFILSLGLNASAQTIEEFLTEIKTLSSEKNYDVALQVISNGLEMYPQDADLEIYRTRMYLWMGEYPETETLLVNQLEIYPDNYEVHQLNNNLYLWQEKWEQLLAASSASLSFFPDDLDFKTKKVIALKNLKKYKEAIEIYESTADKSPTLISLGEELKMVHHQQIGLTISRSQFSSSFDPWTTGRVEYQYVSKNSFNISTTYANMFNQTGTSFNAEFYPRLSNKISGFFEAGGSSSAILPKFRFGGEIILEAKKIELSVGAKLLNFRDQDEAIRITTAAVGWYYKKFYANFKGYLTTVEATHSTTGSLLVRRTFNNRYHYVQVNLAQGATPLQINNFAEISRINSTTLLLSYSHFITNGYVILISAGTQNEEYVEGVNRDRYSASISFSKQF
ncbi:YaiO family outer membrane beta-barrel protein [Ekhidna sp.]|uniref:YaiO family outer membrane beta-barrel protein n=1 Tax=Ekhidna sp. TaxID=2608089 RepID=UPI00329A6A18